MSIKENIHKILLVLVVIGCFTIGCSANKGTAENADTGIIHTGFYVDGTTLRDANGNEFIMRGINSAHCWYLNEDETAFDAIAETGSNCIRIVCAAGIQWDADTAESIEYVIEAANSRDMIAILELHDGTGSDDIEVLKTLAGFWCNLADVLSGTEDKVILNIANEWCGSWNSKIWRDGYLEVIPMIREAGIKNTIMVDAGGWGQRGASIKKYGLEVFKSDPDRNTMFSVHMYGYSGKNARRIRNNLEGVTKQNLCVCVGEFGYTHTDGDVDEDYLMRYCVENGIGYLAWSWKGNSGGTEYLDLALEWDGSVLSSEWGDKVINGENGIKATSKKCTIFKYEIAERSRLL